MRVVLSSTVASLTLTLLTSLLGVRSDEDLEGRIQAILAHVSSVTGYGFSVGYQDTHGVSFGVASGPRATPDELMSSPPVQANQMTPNDTFVLGSGSKPFTAAGVMRLVDAGKIRLDDPIVKYLDVPMNRMWNTTLEALFGPTARNVTVAHVIRMKSGLGDIEGVKGWERSVLFGGVDDPIDDLRAVARTMCSTGSCVWHFAPGTETEYCSTNFLLAGLLLLAHAPVGQQHWQSFDQRSSLTENFSTEYPHCFFPTFGPLQDEGLSSVGNCYIFGRAQIATQDASIMGMGWGGTVASAWDVARFYFDLLAPMGGTGIVSSESLAYMQTWEMLSYGWDTGTKRYGAGLETNNPTMKKMWRAPPLDHIATGIGHHGQTYSFECLAGFYPKLNASITVATNQDSYFDFESAVSCPVVQEVARHMGWKGSFNCTEPRPVTYLCANLPGTQVQSCVPAHPDGSGTTKVDCARTCT